MSPENTLGLITVGRKTPADGKLELTAEAANRLGQLPSPMRVHMAGSGDAPVEATLSSMRCTCQKSEGGASHSHYFLESPRFHSLVPGDEFELRLHEDGLALVRPAGRNRGR